jgi:mono/diheme cytochrome c family protein
MKSKLLVLIAFIGILLFVVACSPSISADTADVDQVEEEHMDEDDPSHNPGEHMAGAHNVPEEAAAVPNPISDTEDSVESGGAIFATNCAVCHGAEGRGDGPSAESLETKPADLTEGHVQELSDGSLFYIVSHGKPETPMPAWEGVLEEEDRWNVVNFLRTLVDEHAEEEHMEDEHMEDEHMEGDEHMEDEHSE